MTRRILERTSIFPYHITTRSNNKEWFAIPTKEVWEIAKHSLEKAYKKHPFELLSFVLMYNHYHMFIRTPGSNVDKIMFELNRNFSKLLRIKTNRINKMFGGRYKWTIVDNKSYFHNVIKYIYQNPIKAGLSNQCETYPFSTLYYQMNNITFCVPLSKWTTNLTNIEKLKWLNQTFTNDQNDCIRRGLKRAHFKATSKGPKKQPLCNTVV